MRSVPFHEADSEWAQYVLENFYDNIAQGHELEESFLEKTDEEARVGLRDPVVPEKLEPAALVPQLLRQKYPSISGFRRVLVRNQSPIIAAGRR
jgi:hypothetical protein